MLRLPVFLLGIELKVKKKLLVTGCGRCGSKYMSVLLRAIGLDVKHEQLGEDGIVSWYMAVDTDKVPLGPSSEDCQFDHTLQLVREPLAAIKSICDFSDEAWQFICRHIPCDMSEPVLLRAAKYWHYWNLKAEEKAQALVRVEDQQQIITVFKNQLAINVPQQVLEELPQSVNSRRISRTYHRLEELLIRLKLYALLPRLADWFGVKPTRQLRWQDLTQLDPDLTQKIKNQAKKYGYDN